MDLVPFSCLSIRGELPGVSAVVARSRPPRIPRESNLIVSQKARQEIDSASQVSRLLASLQAVHKLDLIRKPERDQKRIGSSSRLPKRLRLDDYVKVHRESFDVSAGTGRIEPWFAESMEFGLGYVSKNSIVDFSEFDHQRVLVDREGICKVNPHRFEMLLLDGILLMDEDRAVGFKDIEEDAFWVRGHFPGKPLMPGVLICECAAQLSSFFSLTMKMVDSGYVGLGGLENVRFRGPVVPGDRLVVMLKKGKVRPNRLFFCEFQGYVGQTLVVEGGIKGVALGT
jgi:3-hydroxyacyl-[acyl-carrier-protein] dehydratase